MQLFKTEMMFMHPPRTQPYYITRSKRARRYGCQLQNKTPAACGLKLHDDGVFAVGPRGTILRQLPPGVERAA